jgi:hypothetical protein
MIARPLAELVADANATNPPPARRGVAGLWYVEHLPAGWYRLRIAYGDDVTDPHTPITARHLRMSRLLRALASGA